MAKSARKIIAQLTQPKYALLKDLTDLAALDAPGLQAAIAQAVADRLALAGGLLRAAVVIGKHEDPITRRSAVSRAYYGAYQAARATVFGVHGRDEGDHDRVAQLVDEIVRGQGSVQTALKELRDLRNEMDYSPYPGISGDTEYDEESLERVIGDSTKKGGESGRYVREVPSREKIAMPILQMDAEDVKRFIHSRLANNPKFRTVIAISVDRYPQEFSVKVWVGEEPTTEMRQVGYELESELANLGVPCSIIIKTDRELPFGGAYALQTKLGELSYRYHRIDPERDEDEVYVFSLFRGTETYRFRISLTGTLASMLRSRNRLNEERVLTVYRNWIRQEIEASQAHPSVVNDKMFNSNDIKLFGPN